MAITRTPQIDDDGSGTTGTIWNNAWKTELYNQIDAMGVWVNIPVASVTFYAAGGAGGVWGITPSNIQTLAYTNHGNTGTVAFSIVGNNAIGATAASLNMGIAGLPVPQKYVVNPFSYYVDTLAGTGVIEIKPAGLLTVTLYPALGGALWPAVTNMYLMGQISYPIG